MDSSQIRISHLALGLHQELQGCMQRFNAWFSLQGLALTVQPFRRQGADGTCRFTLPRHFHRGDRNERNGLAESSGQNDKGLTVLENHILLPSRLSMQHTDTVAAEVGRYEQGKTIFNMNSVFKA